MTVGPTFPLVKARKRWRTHPHWRPSLPNRPAPSLPLPSQEAWLGSSSPELACSYPSFPPLPITGSGGGGAPLRLRKKEERRDPLPHTLVTGSPHTDTHTQPSFLLPLRGAHLFCGPFPQHRPVYLLVEAVHHRLHPFHRLVGRHLPQPARPKGGQEGSGAPFPSAQCSRRALSSPPPPPSQPSKPTGHHDTTPEAGTRVRPQHQPGPPGERQVRSGIGGGEMKRGKAHAWRARQKKGTGRRKARRRRTRAKKLGNPRRAMRRRKREGEEWRLRNGLGKRRGEVRGMPASSTASARGECKNYACAIN